MLISVEQYGPKVQLTDQIQNVLTSIQKIEYSDVCLYAMQVCSGSVSRSLREIIGGELLSLGWDSKVQMLKTPLHRNGQYRFEYGHRSGIALSFVFGNRQMVARELILPNCLEDFKDVQTYPWHTSLICCVSEDLKNQGKFDGAVATGSEVRLMAAFCNSLIRIPTYVVEISI
jgi:hypothetical protein